MLSLQIATQLQYYIWEFWSAPQKAYNRFQQTTRQKLLLGMRTEAKKRSNFRAPPLKGSSKLDNGKHITDETYYWWEQKLFGNSFKKKLFGNPFKKKCLGNNLIDRWGASKQVLQECSLMGLDRKRFYKRKLLIDLLRFSNTKQQVQHPLNC